MTNQTESLKKFDQLVLEGKATWWEMKLPSGQVVFGSAKAEMLGFPEENFKVYQDFTSLLHPDDYETAMEAMRDLLSGKEEYYQTTYRIKNNVGEYVRFFDYGKIQKQDSENTTILGLVFHIENDAEMDMIISEILGNNDLFDLFRTASK